MSEAFSRTGVARQLDECTYCPKLCRHACPVSEASGREPFTPQAKMHRLNQLRRGQMPWTAESAEPLYACTGCRQCTTECLHDNEPGLVLFGGRAVANARGAGHPALAGYPDRFRNREQRLVETGRERFASDWYADSAPIGFWPGCDAVDKAPRDVEAALEVFENLGLDDIRLVNAEQTCGGYPLLAAGLPDMFRWHATRVAESLRPYPTVVMNCSACLYTMQNLYAAEGVALAPRVISLAEYLAEYRDRIKFAGKRRSVYYHDPCYMARYTGVTEEPRQVLSQLANVNELGPNRKDTECCGGAGLLPKTMPEVADSMARGRLKQVAARGGGTVVSSCATCTFMLKRNAPSGVDVMDLAAFVAKRTRKAGSEGPSGAM